MRPVLFCCVVLYMGWSEVTTTAFNPGTHPHRQVLQFSFNHPTVSAAVQNKLIGGSDKRPAWWNRISDSARYAASTFRNGNGNGDNSEFTIVMFRSNSCLKCRYLYKKINRHCSKGMLNHTTLYEIDTTVHCGYDLAMAMGIKTVPTFIIYRNGAALYTGSDIYHSELFLREVLQPPCA